MFQLKNQEVLHQSPEESLLGFFQINDKELDRFYVLGSFAKYVTVYSQQIRSLNLVHSLISTGAVKKDSHVVIIGGGIAGLTAAVAMATHDVNVSILEHLDGVLCIQSGSSGRYVHPNIYDWPLEGAFNKVTDLPFMNWRADYANNVMRQLEKEWDRDFSWYKNKIKLHLKSKSINFEYEGKNQITVTWNSGGAHSDTADIVIFALGYGLESMELSQSRYWHNDSIDIRDNSDVRKCLVIGCGDGGLTDLMRLCIKKTFVITKSLENSVESLLV